MNSIPVVFDRSPALPSRYTFFVNYKEPLLPLEDILKNLSWKECLRRKIFKFLYSEACDPKKISKNIFSMYFFPLNTIPFVSLSLMIQEKAVNSKNRKVEQRYKFAFFDALTNGYWYTRYFSISLFSTSNFIIFR